MEKIKNKAFKKLKNMEFVIDAKDMHYRLLNSRIKEIAAAPVETGCPNLTDNSRKDGEDKRTGKDGKDVKDGILNKELDNGRTIITLKNVMGQRFIGNGMRGAAKIKIFGVPGNDMAVFMDGPEIEVFDNVQDGVANTMNSGRIIVHGSGGDIMGYSMRGGEIYIRDNVGWRTGIHMKSYQEKFPVIVIGGRAGNFLGEYMAGGIIIVLDINFTEKRSPEYYFEKFYASINKSIVGDYAGTGMHGGVIYLRGNTGEYKTGKEVRKMKLNQDDIEKIGPYIRKFCSYFNAGYDEIISKKFKDFIKLVPYSQRPYGKIYAY